MNSIESLRRLHCVLLLALVVVNNFDVMGIAVMPDKAEAPLVIDTNAVRSRSGASQQLKLIPRRHAKTPSNRRALCRYRSFRRAGRSMDWNRRTILSKKPGGVGALE